MNYQKIYDKIIEKAKSENRIKHSGIYYEEHHIIPKCLNGNDEKSNKVLLTAREHFICHKLLTYIYKENRSIICSLFRMTFDKRGRKVSSRDYEYAKKLLHSSPMPEYQKQQIRKKLTGLKQSPETIEKRMKKIRGRVTSEETKQKLREANIGKHDNNNENNPMFGKKHSSISIILMRNAKLKKHNINLTSENILEIKKLYKVVRYGIIAKMYNVSYNTVRHIFDGRYDWLTEIEQISRGK